MKTKYIFVSCLASVLAFSGCQEIDTFPEGNNTVTSAQKDEIAKLDPTKLEAGVNAIYAQLNQYMPNKGALGMERHNDIGYPSVMLFTESNGSDMVSDNNGYNWMGGSLTFEDRIYTSAESQMIWNNLYGLIYTSNNVIVSIPETEDITSVNKKFLGQAYAARSFGYFLLAQLFQFNYVNHESAPCVPLVTDKNREDVLQNGAPRATVEQVYQQINSDLNKSIELLSAAEADKQSRADRRYIDSSVAYGLRARVNMTMQRWKEALADATKAIELSDATPAGLQDVNKPTFWSMDEKDWMWGIKVVETDRVVTSGIVNWPSHMGSLCNGYANYSQGMQINKKLFASIPESDVRKGWWLNDSLQSPNLTREDQKAWMAKYYKKPYTQVKFGPYNDMVGQGTNANDIPLMRIEEMYLIKAEAEAMAGNPAAGKTTLENFVKEYRDPSYKCTAASASDVQEAVYFQRRIELWGEGLGWSDIMRLNKGIDRRGAGYPNATSIFNIPAGSDILLWRIPEKEIQANKALSDSDNNPAAPLPTPIADNK